MNLDNDFYFTGGRGNKPRIYVSTNSLAEPPNWIRAERVKSPIIYTGENFTAEIRLSYPINYSGYFQIKKVIFNNPATIVFWTDGTKTVVKCAEGDTFSKETGLALAFMKKAHNNKGNYNDVLKKWICDN